MVVLIVRPGRCEPPPAHDLLNALCTVRMAFRLIQSGKVAPDGVACDALVRALDHMEKLLVGTANSPADVPTQSV
jgi:hypothetical protein